MKLFAAGAAIVLTTFLLILPAPRGETVAAVFPPWWTQPAAVTAASSGGEVLRVGARFVVVVRAPADEDRARLRRAGALALLDPAVAGLCGEERSSDV